MLMLAVPSTELWGSSSDTFYIMPYPGLLSSGCFQPSMSMAPQPLQAQPSGAFVCWALPTEALAELRLRQGSQQAPEARCMRQELKAAQPCSRQGEPRPALRPVLSAQSGAYVFLLGLPNAIGQAIQSTFLKLQFQSLKV